MEDARNEIHVAVVHGLGEAVDVGLEGVLVLVEALQHPRLDDLELPQHIDRRLLVSRWRVAEVGQRAVKLQGGVVILDEAQCHGRVEGHARQTIEDMGGRKEPCSVWGQVSQCTEIGRWSVTYWQQCRRISRRTPWTLALLPPGCPGAAPARAANRHAEMEERRPRRGAASTATRWQRRRMSLFSSWRTERMDG
jgi:hypothetical protein